MPKYHLLITDGLDASAQAVLDSCTVDDRTGISAEDLSKIIADYDALIVRGRTKVAAPLPFRCAPCRERPASFHKVPRLRVPS